MASRALGKALREAWGTHAEQWGRKDKPATTWRTQLWELKRSGRGRQALADAGISDRRLKDWAAGRHQPSRASLARVTEAYGLWFLGRRAMNIQASQLPTDKVHVIYGRVVIGIDDRDRRNGLRVDGAAGDWSALQRAWRQSSLNPTGKPGSQWGDWADWDSLIADLFVGDVLMADFGEISEASEPDFPGVTYTVELE